MFKWWMGWFQRLLQSLDLHQLRCSLRQHRGGLRRSALPVASGLVGSHLNLQKSPRQPRRRLPGAGEHPGVGDQRREFKAAPSSLAVSSTMGMTRS